MEHNSNSGDNYLVVMFSVIMSSASFVLHTVSETMVNTVNKIDYYVLGPIEKFTVFVSVVGSLVATGYQISPKFKRWFIKKFNLGNEDDIKAAPENKENEEIKE